MATKAIILTLLLLTSFCLTSDQKNDQGSDSNSSSESSIFKKVLKGASLISGAALGPAALGFTSVGPGAATVAAAVQASIGNVVAGSLFSMIQSVAMTTVLGTIAAPVAVVGIVGFTGYVIFG